MNVETFKSLAEGAQAVATTIAIIVGAWWTWTAFIRERIPHPKAAVEHVVTHRRLPTGHVLIRVSLRIANCGVVALPVQSTIVRVQRVLPLPETVATRLAGGEKIVLKGHTCVDWELIDEQHARWGPGEHELEPGEQENTEFDFAVDPDVRVLQVYTYVRNATKRGRDIGWGSATLYSLEVAHDAAELKS